MIYISRLELRAGRLITTPLQDENPKERRKRPLRKAITLTAGTARQKEYL